MRMIGYKRNIIVKNSAAMFLCAVISVAAACSPKQEKRYHCPDAGFSISFPKDWKISENLKGTRILAEIPEEEGITIIKQNTNVVVEEVKVQINLNKYMESQINGLQRLKGMKLLNRGEASIDGVPARWFIYSYTVNDFGYQALVYAVNKNARYYIITGISQIDNYNKYENVFRTISMSFKFE